MERDKTHTDRPDGSGAHTTILGAGVAGLAAGYYARKKGAPVTLYEAADHVGGLCATIRHGDFLFDCGAHRFHDRDPDITREIKALLGDRLKKVHAPSHVFHEGALVNFPFTPVNIVRHMGLVVTARAGLEVLGARCAQGAPAQDFESFAIATYGETLARLFLLNYSEKLWGLPCDQLSPAISGERLKGFTPRALLLELLTGRRNGAGHVDGVFYYPTGGIGAIPEALAAACGPDRIHTRAAVTGVHHERGRITAVTIHGRGTMPVDRLVSTLPCTVLADLLQPRPPERIMQCARRIRFRDIILVALFLNRESATQSATVYFPSPEFCFTRIYEPRNRSAAMAPPGRTSLVAEIPCHSTGLHWALADADLAGLVQGQLAR